MGDYQLALKCPLLKRALAQTDAIEIISSVAFKAYKSMLHKAQCVVLWLSMLPKIAHYFLCNSMPFANFS